MQQHSPFVLILIILRQYILIVILEKRFKYEDIFKCFVREFEYGTNRDGYLSYENLIIQLEDCIDVTKGIYGNNFILQFMVDHSCGHDWQLEDGLNVKSINFGHSKKSAA